MKIIKLWESYPHSYLHSAADLMIGLILCGFDICCDGGEIERFLNFAGVYRGKNLTRCVGETANGKIAKMGAYFAEIGGYLHK